MGILLEALFIFVLRVVGISVSTVSTILTVQGRRFPAILTGSLGALIYVVAIGRVVTNLENVWNVAAYVVGFGVGTWVGMLLEGRMALGYAEVRIISPEHGAEIAAALRQAGFGVTEWYGKGRESTVGIVDTVVPRKSIPAMMRIAEATDAQAMVTISDARHVQRGYLHKPELRR
jgi:uncharacterized protein YebE (UPF0316 family)